MEVIKWGFDPECEPLGCATEGLLPPHTGGDNGGGNGCFACVDKCYVHGW